VLQYGQIIGNLKILMGNLTLVSYMHKNTKELMFVYNSKRGDSVDAKVIRDGGRNRAMAADCRRQRSGQ
jgi:hypothetical protein